MAVGVSRGQISTQVNSSVKNGLNVSALTGLTENCMVFAKQIEAIPVRNTNVLSSCWYPDTQKTDWVIRKCTVNANTVSSQHPGTQSGKQCF